MHKNTRGCLPDVFVACGRSSQKLTVCFRDGFPRFNDRLGDVGSTVYGPISLF